MGCPTEFELTDREAWHSLFSDPLLSLANLKALAAGPGLGHAGDDGGIILRSVYWRVSSKGRTYCSVADIAIVLSRAASPSNITRPLPSRPGRRTQGL